MLDVQRPCSMMKVLLKKHTWRSQLRLLRHNFLHCSEAKFRSALICHRFGLERPQGLAFQMRQVLAGKADGAACRMIECQDHARKR